MTKLESARPPTAYEPADGFFDELFEADGTPRPHAAALAAGLQERGPELLAAAGRRRDAIFVEQGITLTRPARMARRSSGPSRSTSCRASCRRRSGRPQGSPMCSRTASR